LSKNGVYFETREVIKKGATVFLQFTKFFPENLSLNDKGLVRNVGLGEVKHSKEIIKEHAISYGVGVRYLYEE